MIRRYQRILFFVLLGGSIVMLIFILYLRGHAYGTVHGAADIPMEAPSTTSAESVTLELASDADGAITAQQRSFALPVQPAVRARALLEHLLAEYALPSSEHPLGGGIAVDDVFLVPLPLAAPPAKNADGSLASADSSSGLSSAGLSKEEQDDPLTHASGELAVVNLRSSWADAHPSGLTSETLTLRSILGTLHANLPEITQVRFLVDGQTRATLAGDVSLDRTYAAVDTATSQTGLGTAP